MLSKELKNCNVSCCIGDNEINYKNETYYGTTFFNEIGIDIDQANERIESLIKQNKILNNDFILHKECYYLKGFDFKLLIDYFNNPKYKNKKSDFLYFIYFIENKKMYTKIGITSDIDKRMKELQTGNPFKLLVKYIFYDVNALNLEKEFHKIFENKKIRNEWFMLDKNDFNFVHELMREYYKI